MTAVRSLTCQPPLTRLRPPQLAALPEVTAALAAFRTDTTPAPRAPTPGEKH